MWTAICRNINLSLEDVTGLDLPVLVSTNGAKSWGASAITRGNGHVLTQCRAKARTRRRVAAVGVLRQAWQRSAGRPPPAPHASTPPPPAAALARMLQLRRLCRTREGMGLVEPFGQAVVMYL